MTARIHRHDLSGGPEPGELAKDLEISLAEDVDQLREHPESIDSAFGTSTLILSARSVVDPVAAKAETWDATVNAMQLGTTMFALTNATEGTLERRINQRTYTLEALGNRTFAHAGNWLTAFYLAAICREPDRMTELCQVPIGNMRAVPGETDEFNYRWIDTLQTYWLRREGLAEKLTATIEASDPSRVTIAPQDLLQGVLYPPINLFYHLVRRDTEGFAPALEEALKLHRAYWTLTDDRRQDIDGAIALGPLAIASWAFDGDFPLDVESEYLPKHLLQHSWLGEYPT
ncbi:immunity 49 family protein [Streptomyces indicus]|uniref:Immunity protein 49 n=1 Tax=Streptomyces indicus TaxID=417292 RepID=A0A1G9G1J5_9ACTN|nr:immunity 49 family protein [Streptomyces indicus]SDK94541.1 Immunity protein 49 [Streptomyces indicus]